MNVSVNYSENVEPDFQLGIDFVLNSFCFLRVYYSDSYRIPFTMMRQV